MSIIESKNVNTGPISSDGGVHIGDVINISELNVNLNNDQHYKALEAQLYDLGKKAEIARARAVKYPEDEDFKGDVIAVDTEREKIEKAIEDFKKDIIELAEAFNKIDIDSDKLRIAKEYFEAGEFQKVREELDSDNIEKELEALLKEKHLIEQKGNENEYNLQIKANELLILARLTNIDYTSPSRLKDAEYFYRRSIEAASGIDNTRAFMHFLIEQGKHTEAIKLNADLLLLLRQDAKNQSIDKLVALATALNVKGILLSKTGQFDIAVEPLNEALAISRDHIQENETEFLRLIGAISLNKGSLFIKTGNSEAEVSMKESLEARKTLADANPEVFLPHVPEALTGLGLYYRSVNQFKEAKKYYTESLNMCNSLVDSNQLIIMPLLAMTMINWINASIENFDNDTSEIPQVRMSVIRIAIKRAYSILNQLCRMSPNEYLPVMATLCVNISIFNRDISIDRSASLQAAYDAMRFASPFASDNVDSRASLEIAQDIIRTWEYQ